MVRAQTLDAKALQNITIYKTIKTTGTLKLFYSVTSLKQFQYKGYFQAK